MTSASVDFIGKADVMGTGSSNTKREGRDGICDALAEAKGRAMQAHAGLKEQATKLASANFDIGIITEQLAQEAKRAQTVMANATAV